MSTIQKTYRNVFIFVFKNLINFTIRHLGEGGPRKKNTGLGSMGKISLGNYDLNNNLCDIFNKSYQQFTIDNVIN